MGSASFTALFHTNLDSLAGAKMSERATHTVFHTEGQGFIILITPDSPGSAHTASKTAETFETLAAERFPPHSGFSPELSDTHMIIFQYFILSSCSNCRLVFSQNPSKIQSRDTHSPPTDHSPPPLSPSPCTILPAAWSRCEGAA